MDEGGSMKQEADVPEEPELTTEYRIHQLNLRLGAIINAAPSRSLVMVMPAMCREAAPNRVSAAHGALFSFVKGEGEKEFSPLPANFTDFDRRRKEEERHGQGCTPS